MIEITFNVSAWVGLRIAQTYGQGKYKPQGKPAVMFYGTGKGSKLARWLKVRKVRKEWQERERLEWESAQPLGGKPQDIYYFDLRLSMGSIAGKVTGDERRAELMRLFSIYDESGKLTERHFQEIKIFLEQVEEKVRCGESVRIWYSDDADDYCGMLWFVSELCSRKLPVDKVFMVKVPSWGETIEGRKYFSRGTQEVNNKDWHMYAQSQQHVPEKLIELFNDTWIRMQEDNSQLRVIVNGSPASVPENFYDSLIWQAIGFLGEKFRDIQIISKMLNMNVRVDDAWILHRLEQFVKDGRLEMAGPDPDLPSHNIYKRKD
ncbi:MAG: DUF1835 domain-containing protein [Firmicutes bacterium]|nr:DUF1835 domain-containing protein [Bacillota bacterium]